jgi:peptidoglycan/xylan/chitin deacetylase (PgdA/CDA1 family)
MTAGERLKYAVKFTVSHALYALGLLQLWQHIVMRHRAVILMYHRVLTSEERSRTGSHPGIVVDRETFARQMAVLKRRFVVLSLEEFADRMERNIPFDDSSCLITFDDGWRDNFTHALPILRHHRLPAVIFLPVNFIGRRRLFWQEALAHLVFRAVMKAREEPARRARLRERLAVVHMDSLLDLSDDDPRPAVIVAIGRQKGVGVSVIEATVAGLAEELGVRVDEIDGTDGFLDWEQIEEMSRHGIAFAGHGAEHRLLTDVSIDEAWSEIRTAKDVLDRRFKETVPAFSYPNGYRTPEVVDMVKASGYRLAFITRRGLVSCEDDRFTVRRINIHESVTNSTPMFLARLVGLF